MQQSSLNETILEQINKITMIVVELLKRCHNFNSSAIEGLFFLIVELFNKSSFTTTKIVVSNVIV